MAAAVHYTVGTSDAGGPHHSHKKEDKGREVDPITLATQ